MSSWLGLLLYEMGWSTKRVLNSCKSRPTNRSRSGSLTASISSISRNRANHVAQWDEVRSGLSIFFSLLSNFVVDFLFEDFFFRADKDNVACSAAKAESMRALYSLYRALNSISEITENTRQRRTCGGSHHIEMLG